MKQRIYRGENLTEEQVKSNRLVFYIEALEEVFNFKCGDGMVERVFNNKEWKELPKRK